MRKVLVVVFWPDWAIKECLRNLFCASAWEDVPESVKRSDTKDIIARIYLTGVFLQSRQCVEDLLCFYDHVFHSLTGALLA